MHLEDVLRQEPDNLVALELAAFAAHSCGDPRGEGWQRLFVSLTALRPTEGHPDALTESGNGEESFASPGRKSANEAVDWDSFLSDVVRDAERRAPITLSDVGGLNDVKQRLELSFLGPLRNPELRKAYGAQLRGGILLWGPPGCGKTFLARAIAGELGAQFISIGLNHVLDMYLGNSEKQLHELFEFARRSAPCVLFFDELDAIGHSRMDLGRSAGRNVVVQLLTELDGFESTNEGIFVIGATNQPWDVDPALRRPGRFDRTMLVLPPDEDARTAIFETVLRDRPIDAIDFESLAKKSDGYSGADIHLVCADATERALAEAMLASTVKPVTMEHLLTALSVTRLSTTPWFDSARNHVRYANESGDYDELAKYLKKYRPPRS